MDHSINLAVDVDGDPDRVFEILSTTDGQRAFWTADCDAPPTAHDSASKPLLSTSWWT